MQHVLVFSTSHPMFLKCSHEEKGVFSETMRYGVLLMLNTHYCEKLLQNLISSLWANSIWSMLESFILAIVITWVHHCPLRNTLCPPFSASFQLSGSFGFLARGAVESCC